MKEEKFPNTRKPSHWRVCGEFWNLRGQHNQEGKNKTKNPTNYASNCNSQRRSSPDTCGHQQRAGAEHGGLGCMLRVRTGPECPEDNLRELTWDSNPNCGIAWEKKRERDWERIFPQKALRHCRATHRTKDCENTRVEPASCELTHPPTRGREAGGRQPEPEGERQSLLQRRIHHQTVSRLPVANQVFLRSWTIDICQEVCSQRLASQRRYTAHLRWRSCCAPRKPRGWNRGGDKTHRT